jgi:hypothetical protein
VTWTHFRPTVPGIRRPARLASLTINRRDVLSLVAAAFALIGLILLTVGALVPQLYVLVAGVGALAGGSGVLAGQRRRVRARV